MEEISIEDLRQVVSRQHAGLWILTLGSVDSTNSWLLSHPKYLQKNGFVLRARKQTGGRGRLGRIWQSGEQEQLCFSLVIHSPREVLMTPSLTILAGLAVYGALIDLKVKGVSLKWPNDVLVQGKKVCGILCEAKIILDQPPIIVAGIGVNISGKQTDFSPDIRNKLTTLEMVLESPPDASDLMDAILEVMDRNLESFNNGDERLIFDRWEQVSSSVGKPIRFMEGDKSSTGRISGLGNRGQLLVKTESGKIKEVISGEIEFI